GRGAPASSPPGPNRGRPAAAAAEAAPPARTGAWAARRPAGPGRKAAAWARNRAASSPADRRRIRGSGSPRASVTSPPTGADTPGATPRRAIPRSAAARFGAWTEHLRCPDRGAPGRDWGWRKRSAVRVLRATCHSPSVRSYNRAARRKKEQCDKPGTLHKLHRHVHLLQPPRPPRIMASPRTSPATDPPLIKSELTS